MKLQPDGSMDMDDKALTGRALEEREFLWAAIYDHVRIRMGPSTVIFPLGDIEHENAGRTAGTLFGASANPYTYPKDVRTFDIPLYYHPGPAGIPILSFNGTDEYVESPDAFFWTRDDAGGANGFTLRVWANVLDTATRRTLFGKYHSDGEKEWLFQLDSGGNLSTHIWDKVAGVRCVRQSDLAAATGSLICYHVTYSGLGYGSAGDGITLYENGALKASWAQNNGGYDGMRDSTAVVQLARNAGGNQGWLTAEIAGGPLGPAFTFDEMAPDVVKGQYHLERAALGAV